MFQISTRIYDLETRGKETEKYASEMERCEDLLRSKRYSEAEARINQLMESVNEYYRTHREAFATQYMYEGIKFQDVYLDISMGKKVGFIAYPEAEGKYPGIIFLRGASGSAIDLKRAIHFYAKKNYICLAPEFNSESYLNGTFDLSKWYKVFSENSCVDPQRIGIMSYSRGSAFAYKLIELNIPLKAWVSYWGLFFPSHIRLENIKENPVPILILHGKKDDQCPVEWAYSMERIYKTAGVACQIKVFPDEGHVFSLKAMDEVRGMVGEFLHKYLGKGDQEFTDSVFQSIN